MQRREPDARERTGRDREAQHTGEQEGDCEHGERKVQHRKQANAQALRQTPGGGRAPAAPWLGGDAGGGGGAGAGGGWPRAACRGGWGRTPRGGGGSAGPLGRGARGEGGEPAGRGGGGGGGGGYKKQKKVIGEEEYAVAAGNSARDREQTQNEQDPVQGEHEAQRASGIESGAGREPAVKNERLEHEQQQREGRPDRNHRAHPPVARLGEAVPEVERGGEIKAGEAYDRGGPPRLPSEAVLDALEERERVAVRAALCDGREENGRHHRHAADPENDADDVQGARETPPFHVSLVASRCPI